MSYRPPHVCFYFQVHQPYRLDDLRYVDVGRPDAKHFDDETNRKVFRKVAEKCYLPTNALMLRLLERHPDFHVSYSLSGVFLDQCREYGQDVLDSFKTLADTGKVEFLAETYEHSLSSLKSLPEFCQRVGAHVKLIQELFGQTPTIFRNTELIFSNELAHAARLMGFRGMIAEGADRLLAGRSPSVPFVPPSFRMPRRKELEIARNRPLPERSEEIRLLLKDYRLSDDMAFRFGNKGWEGWPLTVEKFTDWFAQSGGHTVNLFMDYETFGEHQWADTGIFDFLEALPREWAKRGIQALTPSQVLDSWTEIGGEGFEPVYDAHAHVSWADTERDLSAWQGNDMQQAALTALFAMESAVRASGNPDLLHLWRRLQTSDHFYYMCTKYWHDGDVHKYFSPYDSPYEAYRRYSHALEDLRVRLQKNASSLGYARDDTR